MPRPVHRTTANHFLVGVVGLVALLALAGLGAIVSSGGEIPARAYTYVKAEFAESGTLKVRQDVRVNSMIVGQVSDITYDRGRSLVTLRLNGERPAYRNATARILQESALAKSFVELAPGTPDAGPLGEGVIPSAQTENALDLDQVLDVFDPATRTALTGTLDELGRGVRGHQEDLGDALREGPPALLNLRTVAATLADPRTGLRGLLGSADRLTAQLSPRSEQLRRLLVQTDATVAALAVDGAVPLRTTLRDLPPTLTQAREALDSLNGPLGDARQAVTTIRPGGEALAKATPDLRGVLREGQGPLRRVPGVAESAEPAVESLTRAVSDLRPLTPELRRAVSDLNRFLVGASPYACDVGRFFNQLAAPDGLLSGQFETGRHYFQIFLAFPAGPGVVGLEDPAYRTNPYPGLGNAYNTPRPADNIGGGCP